MSAQGTEAAAAAATCEEEKDAAAEVEPGWVILGTIPVPSAAENFLPGTDVFVRFADMPTVSLAAVHPRIAPDHYYAAPENANHPYVVAVDRRFLLHATQGLVTSGREHAPAYFLCDARTGAASRLPDPARNRPVLRHGSVGLVADHRAYGHCMVAQLQPAAGTDLATLLCYSTSTGRWCEKQVRGYSRYLPAWGRDGVVAHEGRLWWVDLSYGLLDCDPFSVSPCLHYVPLPLGSLLSAARPGLDRERCVRVSAGKLRFVEVHGRRPWETQQRVTMWTLEQGGAEEAPGWEREYEAPLAEIWADRSYVITEMPRTAPVLAAVDPRNPRVVYFFLDKWVFAVDVPARRVVAHQVAKIVDPPAQLFSSRYVHAWEDAADSGPDGEEVASVESPSTPRNCISSCDVDQWMRVG